MADEEDDKIPNLKLVSENPNARAERQAAWVKEEVERTLTQFAAALLRTMAGSNTEAIYLMRRLSDFLDALDRFRVESGRGVTIAEIEAGLRLPQTEYISTQNAWDHRQWLREDGFETIVKGALRLAAHKILGEKPHFGGKYSEDVIEAGIKTLEELKAPAKIGRASRTSEMDDGPTKLERRHFGDQLGLSATTPTPTPRGQHRGQGFGQQDLKDLRKAIKTNDKEKIAQLTAKIGKPVLKE